MTLNLVPFSLFWQFMYHLTNSECIYGFTTRFGDLGQQTIKDCYWIFSDKDISW